MVFTLKILTDRMRQRLGLSMVIIVAAILMILLSAARYYYTRRVLDEALDQRAEIEITMKAIIVRSMLNNGESTLRHHVWDIKRNLHQPDSLYGAVRWMLQYDKYIVGGAMAFVPYYYPSRGRLFEPYSGRIGDSIVNLQLAGESHDYTTMQFYQQAMASDKCMWSDPYTDALVDRQIATLGMRIHDDNGDVAGVFDLDMSMEWLGDTLNMRHLFPSSFCLVLSESGQLISKPSGNAPSSADIDLAVKTINDSTVAYTINEKRKSHTRCKTFQSAAFDEKAYVYFHYMRGNPHWQIAVVCYDSEAFGVLDDIQHYMMVFMLLGLGLLGFILYRFMNSNRLLQESRMEHQRIESELQVASKIQQDMLPSAVTNVKNVKLCGVLAPAREVGGDLYDYFVRDDKLYFAIGDVSGKGVPSAIVMAVVHSMFRSFGARESNPSRLMHPLNRMSCENNESCMFVTFFIGVLNLPTGRLRYCNAGHNAPLLISKGVEQLPAAPNMPLGIDSGFFYEGQEITMGDGDTLLLYTDGVTEAMNSNHEQYGMERLMQALSSGEPQELLSDVQASVKAFVADAQQSDDITMLAVRYTPSHDAVTLQRSITFTNDVACISEVNTFVEQVTASLDMTHTDAANVKLAVEEAVANVINYAYPADETGAITLDAVATHDELRLVITDSGTPFAPTDAPDVDTSLSAEERQIGGLGIFLVRQLMDTINYERHDNHNILTLTKSLAGSR